MVNTNQIDKVLDISKITNPHFLFIGGVSAVGKDLIMGELEKLSPLYKYMRPHTTRKLRGPSDKKIHIERKEFIKKHKNKEYLKTSYIGGELYGLLKENIGNAFNGNSIPMNDLPIYDEGVVKAIQDYTNGNFYTVYLRPPSMNELRIRLSHDDRDKTGKRFELSKKELSQYFNGEFNDIIDLDITSETGKAPEIAKNIHNKLIQKITAS